MLLFFQVANQIGLEFDSVSFDSALSFIIITPLFREKLSLVVTSTDHFPYSPSPVTFKGLLSNQLSIGPGELLGGVSPKLMHMVGPSSGVGIRAESTIRF